MFLFSLISMDKVVNCFKKRPDAVARLICFPWAGGGSIHYARWGNVLSSSVEGEVPRKHFTCTCLHVVTKAQGSKWKRNVVVWYN